MLSFQTLVVEKVYHQSRLRTSPIKMKIYC